LQGCLDAVRSDVTGLPQEAPVNETTQMLVWDVISARNSGALQTDGTAALASILKESGVESSAVPASLTELAGRCAAAAAEALSRKMPVYESDGVTVVGEFRSGP